MSQRGLLVRGLILDEVHLLRVFIIVLGLYLYILAAHDRVSAGCVLGILREKIHSIRHR